MFGAITIAPPQEFAAPTRPTVHRTAIRGSYDVAQTTTDNSRHWAWVDSLSARQANTLEVRQVIRERARYEVANDPDAAGMILKYGYYLIGTGPRVQIAGESDEVNQAVEEAFAAWAKAIGLADKLMLMVRSKVIDGEAFAQLIENPRVANPVTLDVYPIECDRITDPMFSVLGESDDGVVYDEFDNPVSYRILDSHPGDYYQHVNGHKTIDAEFMLHWFRMDRPGQRRGVSELTPALGLFAQHRRFRLATLMAAEFAASFAGLLTRGDGANINTQSGFCASAMDVLEIERGMITAMPGDWELKQLEAKHPSTTLEMYNREVGKEKCQPIGMAYNVASGDSKGLNYASGRLDHQAFFRSLKVCRSNIANRVLDRIFYAWLFEASRTRGVLPEGVSEKTVRAIDVSWYWDGFEHVDPVKEATADEIELRTGTTTKAAIFAEKGQDWQTSERQLDREERYKMELAVRRQADMKKLAEELGVEMPTGEKPAAKPAKQEDDDDESQDKDAA